jgi:hypothetical protein
MNDYQSMHHRVLYNYQDDTNVPDSSDTVFVVRFEGQMSGASDKHIAPGAYLVTHAHKDAPLKLLGRVQHVEVFSRRKPGVPAVYLLVARRVCTDFRGFHDTPPFAKSQQWQYRQRHLANLYVQWFDVAPEDAFIGGMSNGIARKAFASGYRHPPLATA